MKRAYLKSFFILTLTLPMLNFANEGDAQEHLPVATRETIAPHQEQEASAQFFNNHYPPVYFSPGMHCLTAVSAFGDSVEIEDGSVWKISPHDAPKVSSWGSQDPIITTQNHRWFSKYQYKLINQSTGSTLEANLYLGPIKDGSYTRYVIAVDSSRHELILNDQTRWRISSYDLLSFQEWMLHDAVIIGHNSGWDSECQGLLINVNMNQCIRAEQF